MHQPHPYDILKLNFGIISFMQGKLILVSGLSGAGKTTLIGGALKVLPKVEYLTTYTTRSIRAGEVSGDEYIFVSTKEYDQLREKSSNWDHTEFSGNYYGADINEIRDKLKRGITIICSIAPDRAVVESMESLYGQKPVTIWIDVDHNTLHQRTKDDIARAGRNEDENAKESFNNIFRPSSNIEEDTKSFLNLVESIIT